LVARRDELRAQRPPDHTGRARDEHTHRAYDATLARVSGCGSSALPRGQLVNRAPDVLTAVAALGRDDPGGARRTCGHTRGHRDRVTCTRSIRPRMVHRGAEAWGTKHSERVVTRHLHRIPSQTHRCFRRETLQKDLRSDVGNPDVLVACARALRSTKVGYAWMQLNYNHLYY